MSPKLVKIEWIHQNLHKFCRKSRWAPICNTANHKNEDGNSPVMAAMLFSNMNILRELVAHPSVDLDTRDCQGTSLEEVAK